MKTITFLASSFCFFLSAAGQEIKSIHLDYNKANSVSYAHQIQSAFKQIIDSDSNLAKMFYELEGRPVAGLDGKYSGEPSIQALTLEESESVNFREEGGTSSFEKRIALYYRFDEGMHRGKKTRSGFFALFDVKGTLTYSHLANDEFVVKDSDVSATFKGFSRTLVAHASNDD
jgi:hypothetical protein